MFIRTALTFVAVLLTSVPALGQDMGLFQTDFPPEEFSARRERVFDSIGSNALALVQGAPEVSGFSVFRQTNTFYYLCGLEVPHAYLLMDGRTRTTTLYLPHRDEARERGEGKRLSAEDADLVQSLTGVDGVSGIEFLAKHRIWTLVRYPIPVLYTPFSPAERGSDSRDEIIDGQAAISADPWDGRPSREGHFINLIKSRFPQFEIRDLSPILDEMRIIKSPREVEVIRRASQLAGLGILEAMRSTEPGVMEYQLDAAARFVFQSHGARLEGYNSITAGGVNAWMGHYSRNDSELKDGDLVLMDYAPDFHNYTSDVTRMWPVNGTYSEEQRQLCEFILAYRNALLKRIRPGVTAERVLDDAADEMREYLAKATFTKAIHRKAAEGALTFRGHLSHPVGMAVHDVGTYRSGPFAVGHVFSVDPMIWVPEETLYVRMEDVVMVTNDGVENFTAFLASTPEEIARTMSEKGILQHRPPSTLDRRER
jgi:Xaa-Pro aminopeptidase